MSEIALAERQYNPEMSVALMTGVGSSLIGQELINLHGGLNQQVREHGQLGGGLDRLLGRYGTQECALVCLATPGSAPAVLARLNRTNNAGAVIECDLGDPEDVAEAHQTMIGEFGGVSVAFLNAGDDVYGRYDELTEERLDRGTQINVVSPRIQTRLAAPYLAAAADQGLSGKVVYSDSLAGGPHALDHQFGYGSDKAKKAQEARTMAKDRDDLRSQGARERAKQIPLLTVVTVGAVKEGGMFVRRAKPELQQDIPEAAKSRPVEVAAAYAIVAYGDDYREVPVVSFIPPKLSIGLNYLRDRANRYKTSDPVLSQRRVKGLVKTLSQTS